VRSLLAVILLVVVALGVWGVAIEPDRLVVRETRLVLPRCPAKLDGLRIAALSDIHAGAPHIGVEKLRQIVAKVTQARPDLVVLLGDYVTRGVLGGRAIDPEVTAAALGTIRAPLGVIAVLGNHDWWYGGRRVKRALEAAGITVLENAAMRVEHEGQPLWLAGLADLATRNPDATAALASVPAADPVIVLTHNPDVFPDVPPQALLTLAGHTHGGQVLLPFVGRLIVPSRFGQRYAIGHVEENGRDLFVTPGIGTSMIPVRIGVPPEISIVILSAPGSRAAAAPCAPRVSG
jgi:uncharacterized protein